MPTNATSSSTEKMYMTITAIIAWLAIVIQYFIRTGNTVNFFSFFTVQCNLIIAISLTWSLVSPTSPLGIFFSKASVKSGIALYIFIVGLVYNTVLRGLVPLVGLAWAIDNVLHVVVPVLYVIYWIVFIPKGVLKYKDGISWTIFPIAYLVYSMIRGSIVHWYPYPFLNADTYGYQKVGLNIAVMIAAFFVVGLLMIALNRSMKQK